MSFSLGLYLFFFSTMVYFFAGHGLILLIIKWLRPSTLDLDRPTPPVPHLPNLVVIIPFYNEANFIAGKLKNLAAQDYPRSLLKVIFVDAGSTDESLNVLKQAILTSDLEVKVYNSPQKGKIQQVNHALNLIGPDNFVLITDCDALISPPYGLQYAVNAFHQNPQVGLVGGWTSPVAEKALAEEIAFWDKQNRMRYLEMKCFSSSIVVAPFYMFRRTLIGNFPQDCIADDVYVSLLTHLKGLRVLYLPFIKVQEIRTPKTLKDLLLHKLRKSNAYMTELFRFIYKIPYMGNRLKYIYFSRLLQFFYMPWGVLGFFVSSLQMLYLGEYAVLIVSYLMLFFLTLLTSLCMTPPAGESRGGARLRAIMATLSIFILTLLVLLVDFFIYPFWRQNSAYKRVPT